MNGPTRRRAAEGRTRPTAKPPRSRDRASMTAATCGVAVRCEHTGSTADHTLMRSLPHASRRRRAGVMDDLRILADSSGTGCWSSGHRPLTDNAPETDMARRGVHRLGMTCGRAIAAAVIRCTQMRSTFQHLARNPDFGLAGVVARLLATAPRIDGNAAGLLSICLVSG